MYPVALEDALKLKELSYIHAEGYAAGELKHGPLALVHDNTPVVALAPSNHLLDKLKLNLSAAHARGADLYLFADTDQGLPQATTIQLPDTHPDLTPILYLAPLHLFAYHTALYRGANVDQPRNLAKSVTVE